MPSDKEAKYVILEQHKYLGLSVDEALEIIADETDNWHEDDELQMDLSIYLGFNRWEWEEYVENPREFIKKLMETVNEPNRIY